MTSGNEAGERGGRIGAAVTAARFRAERLEAWGAEKREQSAWAAWLFDVYERDRECGGGLLAGALAYRFFIWLLPFVLVLVGGLGIVSSAASESPGELAGQARMSAIVSASVQDAARSNARWYALFIGLPILLYTTRKLLRSLIGVNRLVWTAHVRRASPTVAQTFGFLAILTAFPALSAVAAVARASSPAAGVAVTVGATVVFGALWFLASWWLPHTDAPRRALLPGSVVFAIGTLALHVFWGYVVGPLASSRNDTYGSLGIAAALLLGFYFLGRLLVVSAAVNATLWERRHDDRPEGPQQEGTERRELGSL